MNVFFLRVGCRRLALLMVGIVVLAGPESAAQNRGTAPDPSGVYFQQERPSGERSRSPAASRLPDWAEPRAGRSSTDNAPSSYQQSSPTTQRLPNEPPSEVPVDGNLLWLALMGGLYAVWTLWVKDQEGDGSQVPNPKPRVG